MRVLIEPKKVGKDISEVCYSEHRAYPAEVLLFVVVQSERTLLGRLGITSHLGMYSVAEDDGRFVQRPLVS